MLTMVLENGVPWMESVAPTAGSWMHPASRMVTTRKSQSGTAPIQIYLVTSCSRKMRKWLTVGKVVITARL